MLTIITCSDKVVYCARFTIRFFHVSCFTVPYKNKKFQISRNIYFIEHFLSNINFNKNMA